MNNLELKTVTTREATLDEVRDLIFGTGALSWSWWGGVVDNKDGTFDFIYEDPDSEEGTRRRRLVTERQILEAAGQYLSEGRGGEDARDAISDGLGYLDAMHADCILQRAVLGSEVYG